MNKIEIETLKEALEKHLAETQKMWADGDSHAMIVGYLQGTVKGVIAHLEEHLPAKSN